MINLDFKLSENFTIREVVEWPNKIQMPTSNRAYAIRLATDQLTFGILIEAGMVAGHLQIVRDAVNAAFPQYNNRIGFIVTSWFRPVEWELHRNRSGKSQHTTGNAIDFTLSSNVSGADRERVWKWISDYLGKKWPGGVGRYRTFFHVDLGSKREWAG